MTLKGNQINLEKGLANLENKFDTLGSKVIKLENDLKPKIEAALNGYKVVYEKLELIEDKVDHLTDIVESHDIEIKVIKGGK